jgi:hypothetical protein
MVKMRQAVIYSSRKKQRYISRFIKLLFSAVLLAVSLIFLFTGPVKKNVPLTDYDAVTVHARAAADFTAFSLTIEESGPGYSLRYTGQVENGRLYGSLETYNLQVFAYGSRYYVRGGDVYEEWQTVETAELQALASFVRNPVSLLHMMISGAEFTVERGPERVIEGALCRAFLLDVAPSESLLLTLFSAVQEEEISLEKLRVYLWFDKNDEFLYKMALLLDIARLEEKVQVSRVYTMSKEKNRLPDDLPLINRLVEI